MKYVATTPCCQIFSIRLLSVSLILAGCMFLSTGLTYGQSITNVSIDKISSLCRDQKDIDVKYTASGFTSGNVFKVLLSDKNGSFSAADTIGSKAATSSGTINCLLKELTPLPLGTGYKVRVLSTQGSVSATSASSYPAIAPYVTASFLNGATFCADARLYDILVNLNCPPRDTNRIEIQLSDSAGGFASPTLLSTETMSTQTGTFSPSLPLNAKTSSHYRIRIRFKDDTTAKYILGLSVVGLNISPSVAPVVCTGTTATVTLTVPCSFPASNVYSIRLSDATGSFDTSSVRGTVSGSGSATFSLSIPSSQAQGSAYKIRVTSSKYIGKSWESSAFTIANRNLSFTAPSSPLCGGATIAVPYAVSCPSNTGNTFTLQLSDSGGSFGAPLTLATSTVTGSGIFNFTVPSSLAASAHYKMRVVGSSPSLLSPVSGFITVSQPPNPYFTSRPQYYVGDTIRFDSLATNEPGTTYNWYLYGADHSENTSSEHYPELSYSYPVGNVAVTLTVTSLAGCAAQKTQYINVGMGSVAPFLTFVEADSVKGLCQDQRKRVRYTFSENLARYPDITLELSDASGDFTHPVTSFIDSDHIGAFLINLKGMSIPAGDHYRIRIGTGDHFFIGDSSDRFTISPKPSPEAYFTVADTVAAGAQLVFSDVPHDDTYSYDWTYTPQSGSLSHLSGESPSMVVPDTGSYEIRLVVTSSEFGCSNEYEGGVHVAYPHIAIDVAQTRLCPGSLLSVPVTSNYALDNANEFRLELSDSSGSFSTPSTLGSVASVQTGTVEAAVPSVEGSSHYKVRVVSSSPVYTSDASSYLSIESGLIGIDSLGVLAGLTHDSGSHYISCGASSIKLLPVGYAPYGWVLRNAAGSTPVDTLYGDTLNIDTTGRVAIFVSPALANDCGVSSEEKSITWHYNYVRFDSISLNTLYGPKRRIGSYYYVTPTSEIELQAHITHVGPSGGVFKYYRNNSLASIYDEPIGIYGERGLTDTVSFYSTFTSSDGCINHSSTINIIGQFRASQNSLFPVSGLTQDRQGKYHACAGSPVVLVVHGSGIDSVAYGASPTNLTMGIRSDTIVLDPTLMDSISVLALSSVGFTDSTILGLRWHTESHPMLVSITPIFGGVLRGDTLKVSDNLGRVALELKTNMLCDKYQIETYDSVGAAREVSIVHEDDSTPLSQSLDLYSPRNVIHVRTSYQGCSSTLPYTLKIVVDTLKPQKITLIPVKGYGSRPYSFGDTLRTNYVIDSISGGYVVVDTTDFQLLAFSNTPITDSVVWTIDQIGFRKVTSGPILRDVPLSKYTQSVFAAVQNGSVSPSQARINLSAGPRGNPIASRPNDIIFISRGLVVNKWDANKVSPSPASEIIRLYFGGWDFMNYDNGIEGQGMFYCAACPSNRDPGERKMGLHANTVSGLSSPVSRTICGNSEPFVQNSANHESVVANGTVNDIIPNGSQKFAETFEDHAAWFVYGLPNTMQSYQGLDQLGSDVPWIAAKVSHPSIGVDALEPVTNYYSSGSKSGLVKYSSIPYHLEVTKHLTTSGSDAKLERTQFNLLRIALPYESGVVGNPHFLSGIETPTGAGRDYAAAPGDPYKVIRFRNKSTDDFYIVVALVKKDPKAPGYFGFRLDKTTQEGQVVNGYTTGVGTYGIFYSWAPSPDHSAIATYRNVQDDGKPIQGYSDRAGISVDLEIRMFIAPLDERLYSQKMHEVFELENELYRQENAVTSDLLKWGNNSPIGALFYASPNGTNACSDIVDACSAITKSVSEIKALNGQGVILWDIENYHSVYDSYLGAPNYAEILNPRMFATSCANPTCDNVNLGDSPIKVILNSLRDANLIPGVAISPSLFHYPQSNIDAIDFAENTLILPNCCGLSSAGQSFSALTGIRQNIIPSICPGKYFFDLGTVEATRRNEPYIATLMAQRMYWAYKNWGCRLFYIDEPFGKQAIVETVGNNPPGPGDRVNGNVPLSPEIYKLTKEIFYFYCLNDPARPASLTCGEKILLIPEVQHVLTEKSGFTDADAGIRKANIVNTEGVKYYAYASPYRDFNSSLPGEPMGTMVSDIFDFASRFVRFMPVTVSGEDYRSMVRNWNTFYREEMLNCRLIPSFDVNASVSSPDIDHSAGYLFLEQNVFGNGSPSLQTSCVTSTNDVVAMSNSGPTDACNKRFTDPQGLAPYVDNTNPIVQSLVASTTQLISATWISGELFDELVNGVEADQLTIDINNQSYLGQAGSFPHFLRSDPNSTSPPQMQFSFSTGGSPGSDNKEGWIYSIKCPTKSQRIITSFSPHLGPIGTLVTIFAKNFDAVNDRFYLNGVAVALDHIVQPGEYVIKIPDFVRAPTYIVAGPGNSGYSEYASSDVPFVPTFTVNFTPQKVARDPNQPKCNALRCTTVEEGTPNYTHFRWYRILSGQATLINSGGQHFVEMTANGRGVFQLDGLSGQYLHVSGKGQYLIKNWVSDPLYASKRIELWQDPGDISGRTLSVGGGTQLEGRQVDIDVPGSYWVYDINNPSAPSFPLPTTSVISITAEEVAPCGLEFDGTTGLSMSGKSSLVSVRSSSFSMQVKFTFKNAGTSKQCLFTNIAFPDYYGIDLYIDGADNNSLNVKLASYQSHREDQLCVPLKIGELKEGALYEATVVRDASLGKIGLYLKPISLYNEPDNAIKFNLASTTCTTSTSVINVNMNSDAFRIGSLFGSEYFKGQMSDLRVWNRVLSKSEIELYSGRLSGEEDGLIAYWPMVDYAQDPDGVVVKPIGKRGDDVNFIFKYSDPAHKIKFNLPSCALQYAGTRKIPSGGSSEAPISAGPAVYDRYCNPLLPSELNWVDFGVNLYPSSGGNPNGDWLPFDVRTMNQGENLIGYKFNSLNNCEASAAYFKKVVIPKLSFPVKIFGTNVNVTDPDVQNRPYQNTLFDPKSEFAFYVSFMRPAVFQLDGLKNMRAAASTWTVIEADNSVTPLNASVNDIYRLQISDGSTTTFEICRGPSCVPPPGPCATARCTTAVYLGSQGSYTATDGVVSEIQTPTGIPLKTIPVRILTVGFTQDEKGICGTNTRSIVRRLQPWTQVGFKIQQLGYNTQTYYPKKGRLSGDALKVCPGMKVTLNVSSFYKKPYPWPRPAPQVTTVDDILYSGIETVDLVPEMTTVLGPPLISYYNVIWTDEAFPGQNFHGAEYSFTPGLGNRKVTCSVRKNTFIGSNSLNCDEIGSCPWETFDLDFTADNSNAELEIDGKLTGYGASYSVKNPLSGSIQYGWPDLDFGLTPHTLPSKAISEPNDPEGVHRVFSYYPGQGCKAGRFVILGKKDIAATPSVDESFYTENLELPTGTYFVVRDLKVTAPSWEEGGLLFPDRSVEFGANSKIYIDDNGSSTGPSIRFDQGVDGSFKLNEGCDLTSLKNSWGQIEIPNQGKLILAGTSSNRIKFSNSQLGIKMFWGGVDAHFTDFINNGSAFYSKYMTGSHTNNFTSCNFNLSFTTTTNPNFNPTDPVGIELWDGSGVGGYLKVSGCSFMGDGTRASQLFSNLRGTGIRAPGHDLVIEGTTFSSWKKAVKITAAGNGEYPTFKANTFLQNATAIEVAHTSGVLNLNMSCNVFEPGESLPNYSVQPPDFDRTFSGSSVGISITGIGVVGSIGKYFIGSNGPDYEPGANVFPTGRFKRGGSGTEPLYRTILPKDPISNQAIDVDEELNSKWQAPQDWTSLSVGSSTPTYHKWKNEYTKPWAGTVDISPISQLQRVGITDDNTDPNYIDCGSTLDPVWPNTRVRSPQGVISSTSTHERLPCYLSCSPNPADNIVSVLYKIAIVCREPILEIFQLEAGSSIKRLPLTEMSGTIEVNLSQYPAGLYGYRIVSEGTVLSSQRVAVTH